MHHQNIPPLPLIRMQPIYHGTGLPANSFLDKAHRLIKTNQIPVGKGIGLFAEGLVHAAK